MYLLHTHRAPERQTTCLLEADAVVHDIINRREVGPWPDALHLRRTMPSRAMVTLAAPCCNRIASTAVHIGTPRSPHLHVANPCPRSITRSP